MDQKPEKMTPTFDERGLVPAILQDARTHQVLMLAYMNAESLQRTLATGETHFWSRSRQELWHKGATSGNTQKVVEIRLDCDGDALLVLVHPSGPACHTGEISCFFRMLSEVFPGGTMTIDELYQIICDRRDHPTSSSYTARLFSQGEDEIIKKVGEEAIEVLLAAKGQGNHRLVEEVSDLAYHILVLLAAHRVEPGEIGSELERRHRSKSN